MSLQRCTRRYKMGCNLHIVATKRAFPVLYNRLRIIESEGTTNKEDKEEETNNDSQYLFHPELPPFPIISGRRL